MLGHNAHQGCAENERGRGLQQAEAIQEDELAKLPPDAFENGIVLKHPENAALNLKYLWDFFPASYNCPLREKVPAARQTSCPGVRSPNSARLALASS